MITFSNDFSPSEENNFMLLEVDPEYLQSLKLNNNLYIQDITQDSCALISDTKSIKIRKNDYSNTLVICNADSAGNPKDVLSIKSYILTGEKYVPAKNKIYQKLQNSSINSLEAFSNLKTNPTKTKAITFESILDAFPISSWELTNYLNEINVQMVGHHCLFLSISFKLELARKILDVMKDASSYSISYEACWKLIPHKELLVIVLKDYFEFNGDFCHLQPAGLAKFVTHEIFNLNAAWNYFQFMDSCKRVFMSYVTLDWLSKHFEITPESQIQDLIARACQNYSVILHNVDFINFVTIEELQRKIIIQYIDTHALSYNSNERLEHLFSLKKSWFQNELRAMLNDITSNNLEKEEIISKNCRTIYQTIKKSNKNFFSQTYPEEIASIVDELETGSLKIKAFALSQILKINKINYEDFYVVFFLHLGYFS